MIYKWVHNGIFPTLNLNNAIVFTLICTSSWIKLRYFELCFLNNGLVKALFSDLETYLRLLETSNDPPYYIGNIDVYNNGE